MTDRTTTNTREGTRHGRGRRRHRLDAPPSTYGPAPPRVIHALADEWVAKVETFRATLAREPDLAVMVGSDYFHQLWLDNMPQFLIGKAPFYDANWYNESASSVCPNEIDGERGLSSHLLRQGLDAGLISLSNELRIDHSITCPIITLRPEADLPIVPIYTNIFARHSPARSLQSSWVAPSAASSRAGPPTCGLRSSARDTSPSSSAAHGSSAWHGPDPEFDRSRLDCEGRHRGLPGGGDARQSHTPGNATHGFMDLHAHDGRGVTTSPPTTSTLDLFHTMEALLHLVPEGAVS